MSEDADDEKIVPAHQFDVNGKLVTFKQSYPFAENRGLLKAWSATRSDDAATYIPLWKLMIESWEYEGDPGDPKSYDRMDSVSDLWPLMSATLRFWNQRFNVIPKNSVSVSTSP
jgi:hypothetical protein